MSHDFWIALLASGVHDRFDIDDTLVDHRIHANNTSGWIVRKREFTWLDATQTLPDSAVLIDMCIKEWNLDWTGIFLDALKTRGGGPDQPAIDELSRQLQRNWIMYQAARRGMLPHRRPDTLSG